MPEQSVHDQVEEFEKLGFVHLGPLCTPEELSQLQRRYDEVVRLRFGDVPGSITTTIPGSENSLFTMVSPEFLWPELPDTGFARQARRILSRLLGVAETDVIPAWRLFFKPPGCVETAWHQDAAYRLPPHKGGSIWLTLDPATRHSGCMRYLPGTHRGGFREHESHHGHMQAKGIEDRDAVAIETAPGDAIAHHCLTVHGAGANSSPGPRRAIAMVCQLT